MVEDLILLLGLIVISGVLFGAAAGATKLYCRRCGAEPSKLKAERIARPLPVRRVITYPDGRQVVQRKKKRSRT